MSGPDSISADAQKLQGWLCSKNRLQVRTHHFLNPVDFRIVKERPAIGSFTLFAVGAEGFNCNVEAKGVRNQE